MNIQLIIGDVEARAIPNKIYDRDLDDIRSIISDICKAMDGNSNFIVSGFGQEFWPVDVATDLSVFLEQLPEALDAVERGKEFEFFFYEQGIERKLLFLPTEGQYKICCESYLSWEPNPNVEHINRMELNEMLLDILRSFLNAVKEISPKLLTHEWLINWQKFKLKDE